MENNSIEKVHEICVSVLALSENDFIEIEAMAQEQLEYINPLKLKKQKEFNDLGKHNKATINAIRNLKKVLESNPPIND